MQVIIRSFIIIFILGSLLSIGVIASVDFDSNLHSKLNQSIQTDHHNNSENACETDDCENCIFCCSLLSNNRNEFVFVDSQFHNNQQIHLNLISYPVDNFPE